MLASLIIVLREVFEAALVIGIALAASVGLAGSRRAILRGVLAGLLGALLLGASADRLSTTLEGMGPEVFNAGVLLAAVLLLAWHHLWMKRHGAALASEINRVGSEIRRGIRPLGALAAVVALAVLREGAEVVLFLHGVAAGGTGSKAMLFGGLLGLAGGGATGALLYLGLVRIPTRQLFSVTGWLLLLLAAGMAAQAAAFLVQADLLPALIQPLWDSSALIPQQGLAGQVLKALTGYDDRPSAMQLLFFATTLSVILYASSRIGRRTERHADVPLVAGLVVAIGAGLLAAPRAEAAHKIYSPIVEEHEVALELRGHRESDGDPAVNHAQAYKFDLEYAPTGRWLTELVGEWEREPGESLEATEIGWENVFQLFEQGRYGIDAGLLVEYAHALEDGADDKLEVGALLQKEIRRNLMTFNLVAERELSSGADAELEYALQYRWRQTRQFEPGLELHGEFGDFGHFGPLDRHEHEAGPAVYGSLRLGRRALRYEGAWLIGITGEAPAQTVRFLLEYEF